jgi:hypothetical protein
MTTKKKSDAQFDFSKSSGKGRAGLASALEVIRTAKRGRSKRGEASVESKPRSVRLPDNVWDALEAAATERHFVRHELLRQIVVDWLQDWVELDFESLMRDSSLVASKKKTSDLTVELLREIRDDMRQLKDEVHELQVAAAQLNKLRVESEVRMSTAILELRSAVIETRDLVRGIRQDDRIQDLEKRVEELENAAVGARK